MPNWTNNIVEVRGPRKIVKELVDHKFDFMKIYPYPKDLDIMAGSHGGVDNPEQIALVAKEQANLEKHGYRNWYDWCVAEWGTKWNAGGEDNGDMIVDYDEDVNDTGIALFTFDTAWAPPVGIFQKLKELHPDLYVSGRYYEPGMGFFGVWDDGDDRGYEHEHLVNGSKDDFWDTEDGMLLDENFGIVEMLQESESDQMDEDAQKVRDFVEGEPQNTEQTA
jgi:hypothetical protein